jgi:hypothetical protein
MSPIDVRVAKLVADARRDWEQVLLHLGKARSVSPHDGEAPAALVALALDHAYQAFESLLVRVERALGLPERSGPAWHGAILADAAQPIPGARPALLPEDALRDWDGVMRFRHFLRHAYPSALDPEKLAQNVARLERSVAATDPQLGALFRALVA